MGMAVTLELPVQLQALEVVRVLSSYAWLVLIHSFFFGRFNEGAPGVILVFTDLKTARWSSGTGMCNIPNRVCLSCLWLISNH